MSNRMWLVACVVVVIACGLFTFRNQLFQSNIAQTNAGSEPTTLYTREQVANHNASTDCWIVIDKKVYDVTEMLSMHPGGADVIQRYCGEDATQAFNTKDGEGAPHSSSAQSLKSSYQIGVIQDEQHRQTPSSTNRVTNSQSALPQSLQARYPNAQIQISKVKMTAKRNMSFSSMVNAKRFESLRMVTSSSKKPANSFSAQ